MDCETLPLFANMQIIKWNITIVGIVSENGKILHRVTTHKHKELLMITKPILSMYIANPILPYDQQPRKCIQGYFLSESNVNAHVV